MRLGAGVFVGALAVLVAAQALGQEAPTPRESLGDAEPASPVRLQTYPPKFVGAQLISNATRAQIGALRNERAARGGVRGEARLLCVIETDGSVDQCEVTAEEPAGYGIGEMAVKAAELSRYLPASVGGKPTTQRLRFTFPVDYTRSAEPTPSPTAEGHLSSTKPSSVVWPTADEMYEAYPAGALAQHQSGSVKLFCTVGADAHPRACEVIEEQPTGRGFARAAASLAHLMTITYPASAEGGEHKVSIPFHFKPEATPEGAIGKTNPDGVGGIQPGMRVSDEMIGKPSAQRMLAYYPIAARKAQIRGTAVVTCVVQYDGGIGACSVDQEAPAGQGFGSSAMDLATSYRMLVKEVNGQLTYTHDITFTFSFESGLSGQSVQASRIYFGPAPVAKQPARPPKAPRTREPWLIWLPIGFASVLLLAMAIALMTPPPRPRGKAWDNPAWNY